MSTREFHKIWIEQCEAAEGIRERYGVKDACRYLIGEKLIRFLDASLERPEFAGEAPQFVAEIKRIFDPHEIEEFFEDYAAGKVFEPEKFFRGDVDEDGIDEFQVQHDADKILMIENAKRLLLEEN